MQKKSHTKEYTNIKRIMRNITNFFMSINLMMQITGQAP